MLADNGSGAATTVQYRRIHLEIAGSAENRPALRRIERNSCRGVTAGTVHGNLDALFDAGSLSRSYRSKPLILRLLALLAAFWRVLKLLITKEYLLAN